MKRTIDIARDFSDVPSGRFPEDGDFNGQRFREEFLVPLLNEKNFIDIVLDNAEGYGSSFLEEAFGGLVREHGYDKNFLLSHLHLIANSSAAKRYKTIVEQFIELASAKRLGG